LYNILINPITYVEDEVKYNDIDNLNEIYYLEVQCFIFIYLSFVSIYNFIYLFEKNLNIIDCKGTPNPAFFKKNNTAFLLILF